MSSPRQDGREEVDPKLLEGTPIDFGKTNLQEHLLAFASTRNLQQVDHLAFRGRGGGDFPGAQHHTGARDGPRQHRGILVGADLDVFAREQCLQLLLKRRDGLFDDDVVLCATGVTPYDEADRAAAFPSMRISRGATTVASATPGLVIAMRVTSNSVDRTVDRPAVTTMRSIDGCAGGVCGCASDVGVCGVCPAVWPCASPGC